MCLLRSRECPGSVFGERADVVLPAAEMRDDLVRPRDRYALGSLQLAHEGADEAAVLGRHDALGNMPKNRVFRVLGAIVVEVPVELRGGTPPDPSGRHTQGGA